MENEQRIEEYATQLTQLTERVGDAQIAMQLVTEIAKDRRAALIHAERTGNREAGEQKRVIDVGAPATSAQLGMIKRLGGKPSPSMTKGAASELIEALMGNGR